MTCEPLLSKGNPGGIPIGVFSLRKSGASLRITRRNYGQQRKSTLSYPQRTGSSLHPRAAAERPGRTDLHPRHGLRTVPGASSSDHRTAVAQPEHLDQVLAALVLATGAA